MMLLPILHKLFNLKHFEYNRENINTKSIDAFRLSSRQLNDKNNKTRENIIGAIINNKVPEDYYIIQKWVSLKHNIDNYLILLEDQDEDTQLKQYIRTKTECIHRAGRNHNYDFTIIIHYNSEITKEYNVELKFNAESIDDAPQFVSPMKPSQYLTNSYEEYYYDNYLQKLANKAQLQVPAKETYLKQIHSTKPACMKPFQDTYYRGCKISNMFSNNEKDIEFYHFAKELSNESIKSFIEITGLNTEALTNYLFSTQKNKIYMLYSSKHRNKFILQKCNIDDYVIDSNNVIKNTDKCRYECVSKTGKTIKILLRWKNGNGIAFPAFQVS